MEQRARDFLNEASFGGGSDLAMDLAHLQGQLSRWLADRGHWDPVIGLKDTDTVVTDDTDSFEDWSVQTDSVLTLRQMRIRQRLPQVAQPADQPWCLFVEDHLTFELFKVGGTVGLQLYGAEILTCVRDIAQAAEDSVFDVVDGQSDPVSNEPTRMTTADVLIHLQFLLSIPEVPEDDDSKE